MKNYNKLSAFTMAEVLISLIIIGFLFAITVINMSGIMADNNTTKFKKAYSLLESNVYYLVNNNNFYAVGFGFKDTDSISIQNTGEVLGFYPYSKFRDCMKYRLNVVKDGIECKLYNNYTSSSGCFQTDEGIVWGIPDSDFDKKQTIDIKDSFNNTIAALPITFYVDYKDDSTVKDDGIVAAVTFDGKIYMQRNIEGVKCSKNSKEVQCKLDKYISAITIKADDRSNDSDKDNK